MKPLQKSELIADIQAGLDEARRGDFATPAEVLATIRKYTTRNTSRRPERSEGPPARTKERRSK